MTTRMKMEMMLNRQMNKTKNNYSIGLLRRGDTLRIEG